jgi:hypothetical protein
MKMNGQTEKAWDISIYVFSGSLGFRGVFLFLAFPFLFLSAMDGFSFGVIFFLCFCLKASLHEQCDYVEVSIVFLFFSFLF